MTNVAKMYAQGLALLDLGEPEEASHLLFRAWQTEPDNPQYLITYGRLCVELGEYDKARGFFLSALAHVPASALANYCLANVEKQFGQLGDAVEHYTQAIAANPQYAEAFNNRGGAHHTAGSFELARSDYLRAIEINPVLAPAYLNLGRLLDSTGDYGAAADVYRRALAAGLDPGLFDHLLLSVSGGNSDKAPLGYLRTIFDDYAPAFDLHLTRALDYALPSRIGATVRASAAQLQRGLVVIDLGCGTGLCGAELTGCVTHLAGVDASPLMLEQADRRGIYHDLVEGDAGQFMAGLHTATVDAVIAADVFIYIGKLDGIFAQAGRILIPGGLFIFSIESLMDDLPYKLQRTGRFQHTAAYVARLAADAGLTVQTDEPLNLRLEQGFPVPGVLYTLTKTAE